MKQGMFIFSLLILVSCSAVVQEQSTTLLGVWVWEDVDITSSIPVLKKHVLTLQEGVYQEAFFENSTPKGQQEGTLMTSISSDEIEFATVGNVQTVYKGILLGNKLMINTINNKIINPPALYTRN